MDKRKLILDCDVGHDDAIALMIAAKHPALELMGITAVAGNQVLEKVLKNTLHVCEHLDIRVPVYAGMPGPIVREQLTAGDIHGKTGLDGPVFEPLTWKKAEQEHAVNYLIRTIMASDGDITLVPVAPLTNIAVAMLLEPRIKDKIREIVLMGGAFGLGNASPAAEFNILADPEAAHIVFSSGVPIVMMGLDLTNQALADLSIIERMEAIGNKAGKLFGDIMRFTRKTQLINGLTAGPVHDVTAVVYLFAPEVFKVTPAYVQIDISHGPCYGRTVCDFVDRLGKAPNAKVGQGLDLPRFWDIVEETLRLYG